MSVPLDPEALTTVAAVRDGYTTSASDDEVTRRINGISRRFMQRTGRTWAWQSNGSDNPEYVRCQGKFWLYLKRRPITAVAQIKVGMHSYPNGFVGYVLTDYQRTTQWDRQGKIFRLAGWVMLVPEINRLTAVPDKTRAQQLFTAEVQYSGGYILPQYGGVVNATYNPTGAVRDLPYNIEDACIREVRNSFARPYGGLTSERTAGGWAQAWSDKTARLHEFDPETEAMLAAESRPSAVMS